MARRKRHEEHQNHEAWAIPYGDLITLLLAFFVVMYAISSLNVGKYRVVSAALSAAFRGTPEIPDPIQVGTTVSVQMPREEVKRLMGSALPMSSTSGDTRRSDQKRSSRLAVTDAAAAAAAQRAAQLDQELQKIQGDIEGAMAELTKTRQINVRRHGNNIEVQISSDALFTSGSAQLSPRAAQILQMLAGSLGKFGNAVRVEGHTDNVPIRTAQFPSNWELSSARAASVVHLFMDRGIDPQRLSVAGQSQYSPLESNATPAGRSANRRVTVVVLGDQVSRS
ncbi:MAG: flagellar motor protein MotD [Steroidobacteraceae bacterium]